MNGLWVSFVATVLSWYVVITLMGNFEAFIMADSGFGCLLRLLINDHTLVG